ncbi:hypothetical protein MasN3_03580 [Massilia varians]|uniref:Right handed beta helix domain-containing protein n=1 Tax=Massilia varians TaxID=457921 RepID=A0ABN6T827_9BURK|nr:right-handed parallel beta-helix repeat-containing protein [Massilia varians]BDT56864.1 hypothetical protein MasN3_03580 [Massilia varians]
MWLSLGLASLGLAAVAGSVVLYYLDHAGITPRSLGPYVERRSDGHNPLIESIGAYARQWLVYVDRGNPPLRSEFWSGKVGMQTSGHLVPVPPEGQEVLIADSAGLLRAIAEALPGQVITLLPGRYRFDYRILAARPGQADAPIVVRAQTPGSVHLDMNTHEGFKVSAPYWRFENLSMQGKCTDAPCEHAFHVVGNAHHFAAVNNLIVDYNAHVKINGEAGQHPDHGLLEWNTLRNNTIRATHKPVTPIDVVTASHWIVRRNLISDFIKGDGDRISYGAFFKGAGSNNLMEQNLVLCEDRLRGAPGQRVGLSLGGGGTEKMFCRDGGKCITEQTDSTLRANLIASCSDDGIYLNSAARSKLIHNTLIDTGGIAVRFPSSSATIDGNLVDGIVRSRDGGILHMGDNHYSSAARLYTGSHPQRALFRDPLGFDFRWREPAERRLMRGETVPDLCGPVRAERPRYGAFDDFSGCMRSL